MSANKPTKSSKILVTDVDRGSGLAIVRSLAKHGWQVFGASKLKSAPGFRSKYLHDMLIYPAPEDDPEAFIQTIKAFVQEHEIDLIIPVTDEIILPLARIRNEFQDICHLAIAGTQALDIVTNKMKTLELAKSLNIPVPDTHLLSSLQQAKDISETLQYPLVLKPLRSRVYTENEGIEALQVTYTNNTSGFLEKMQYFESRCEVLLQEYHYGEGVGVELLLYKGQPVCAFQHHRLHEVPITGGASAFRESVELDNTLYDYALRLMKELNWTGLAMVEFKVGASGVQLMEINGRVWGSLPLAVMSGMDFPVWLAKIYLDEPFHMPPEVNTDYRRGIRARNLELDIVWLFSVLKGNRKYKYLPTPSRKDLIPALLGYLNPFYYTDIQSWDDPMPGLVHLPQIVQKVFKKLGKQ